MRLLICLLAAQLLYERGGAAGEFSPTGRALHVDDGNFSNRDPSDQEPFQRRRQRLLDPLRGSDFNLRVQVNDLLSRQHLSQAVVEVYINYTRTNAALTGQDGGVLLQVPYQAGLPVTVVASRDGYICTMLPCTTSRMPIFSSVTMSLLGLTQGNIWLFEDSVLITDIKSDASLQPIVQFPKSLLNLTDGSDITFFKAYLTVPMLPSEEESFLNIVGIMSSTSGYVSVELRPVAAVSVQLFSRDTELHVSGPIKISLILPDNCGLQPSNVVPAWFYNRTTGGWMRQGLGTVVTVDGKLTWTFTAPHLGYWIAAPLSSPRGFFGLAVPTDFLLQHSSLLMLLIGGVILIVICLLIGLLSYNRSFPSETNAKKILPLGRRDQSTSTCNDEVSEASSGDVVHSQDGLSQSFTEKRNHRNNATFSRYNGDVIANLNAVAVDTEPNDLTHSHGTAEQMKAQASMTDNVLFYNQPVAIVHASAFFQLEEELESPQWSKSVNLPRGAASNGAATEPASKSSFTQTLTKGASATQNQAVETEDQLGGVEGSQASSPPNTSRGQYGLPESVSVPGTLNKIRDNRHSVHAFTELSKAPLSQPPRAWFVSLEGKPAAEIHYTVSEQQRRRRPAESRETSLDSGVDMSELNQIPGRRTVTLERNATFVKKHSQQ